MYAYIYLFSFNLESNIQGQTKTHIWLSLYTYNISRLQVYLLVSVLWSDILVNNFWFLPVYTEDMLLFIYIVDVSGTVDDTFVKGLCFMSY